MNDLVRKLTDWKIYNPLVCLAVTGAGGVFTAANPGITLSEVVHHYKSSRTRFIISVEEVLPVNLKAAAQCGISASNIFIFSKRPPNSLKSTKYWTDLLQFGEADWIRWDDERRSKNTVAALFPTSGTSGNPKFAMITHYNLVACGTLVHDTNVKTYRVSYPLKSPFWLRISRAKFNIDQLPSTVSYVPCSGYFLLAYIAYSTRMSYIYHSSLRASERRVLYT